MQHDSDSRAQLDLRTNKELRTLAKISGATATQLEDAADADQPREALIALLLRLKVAPPATEGEHVQVINDLKLAVAHHKGAVRRPGPGRRSCEGARS